MAFNINQRLNGLEPLSYIGANAVQPPDFVTKARPPTANDSKNMYLGNIWLDTTGYPATIPKAENVWMLVALIGNQATWVHFGAGGLETLTGNSGGPVSPDVNDNINVVGDGIGITIVGTPINNTLTVSLIGGGVAAQSFPTDSGTATPNAAGVLNIITNRAINHSGASFLFSAPGPSNTVQLNVTDAISNTFIGLNSGSLITSGTGRNTALGAISLANVTTGFANTSIGYDSLNLNTTGDNNTAIGHAAMPVSTTSSTNTAIGANSMQSLTTSVGANTAVGVQSLRQLLTGVNNCSFGVNAGTSWTGAESNNIVIGYNNIGAAGENNMIRIGTPGAAGTNGNTFIGHVAGNATYTIGVAVNNTAVGYAALAGLTTAQSCVGVGRYAGLSNTTGSGNTFLGFTSGGLVTTGINNTMVGSFSGNLLTTGRSNTFIGASVGLNYVGAEDYNILIGTENWGVVGDSHILRIGFDTQAPGADSIVKAFISGIRGITTDVNDAVAVLVDSAGQLGTVSSSARYKENIEPMSSYSDFLRYLNPVVFNYKKHSSEAKSVGLIAEEVAAIAPQLVVYNKEGECETVKYHDLVPMLLNELQKVQQNLLNSNLLIGELVKRIEILESK